MRFFPFGKNTCFPDGKKTVILYRKSKIPLYICNRLWYYVFGEIWDLFGFCPKMCPKTSFGFSVFYIFSLFCF